jgi:hypothetical protein
MGARELADVAGAAAERARIKRATLTAHRDIEKLDAATAKELIGLYRQSAGELQQRIRDYGGGDDTITIAELRSLLDQVNAHLAELAATRNALLDGAITKAADAGLGPWRLQPLAAARIHHDALSFLRTFVAEDGLQLSDRIWRLDRAAKDAVVNAVEQAIIQGHGASQAAREFLGRGKPVPVEVQAKLTAGQAGNVAKLAGQALLTGTGEPLQNALRLFRTEINRAHGEAYMAGGEEHPDRGGWRFLLSPAHPAPDICDLLATQNLHGLGPGVYPSREKTPWPAHPNTLSFVEIVFEDEITAADRAGKETPLEALAKLTPAQRIGVLGKGKHEVFKEGKLKQGMIRAPLSSVKKRVGMLTIEKTAPKSPAPLPGAKPPPATPAPAPAPADATPKTLDDFIAWGHVKAADLIVRAKLSGKPLGEALGTLLLHDLAGARKIQTPAKVVAWKDTGGEAGAALVRRASQRFPDDWTRATDQHGPLYARLVNGRGGQITIIPAWDGQQVSMKGFGTFTAQSRQGYIRTDDNIGTAVHEYAHRMQAAIPDLDGYFQDLHHRRTKGAPLKTLKSLQPFKNYGTDEVTREDKYVEPYQGRIYGANSGNLGKHGALEVMTMAFEDALGGDIARTKAMVDGDREMLDLVIGLLYRYRP